MAGAQVVFNYSNWITRFPEFDDVPATLAKLYFDEACGFCANDGTGRITDDQTQTAVLNLLTAHIAKMNAPGVSGNTNQSVGRVAAVTQGSINVTLQYDVPAGTPQWYAQTKYGAQAFAMMQAAGVFSFFYSPGHPRPMWP